MGRIAPDGDVLVSVAEAATMLNRTKRTVYYLLEQGKLAPHWLDDARGMLINLDEIEELLGKRSGSSHNEVQVNPERAKWLRRWHPQLFS